MERRIIKFRAWDKVNKRMCTVWTISLKAWQDHEINIVGNIYENPEVIK